MRSIFLAMLSLVLLSVNAQSFKKIHRKAIVADTHNDILTKLMERGYVFDNDLRGQTHSDLQRWKEGGLDFQFFSVWSDGTVPNPFAFAIRQIDSLDAIIRRNPDRIVKVFNTKDLMAAIKTKKIAAMIGIEGGHQIEDDLTKLDLFFKRGSRYMTLTWNNSTSWATSAFDETFKKDLSPKGLTDFGRQVIKRMNDLGMMIDVSHVGEQTFWDVIKISTKPVIASHSSVYSICPHQRNLKDDQIKAIAKSSGVVQINFYPLFIDSTCGRKMDTFLQIHNLENDSLRKAGMNEYIAGEYLVSKYADEIQQMRPPFDLVIQHIEYIIKLVGADYVGLGSDFDGIEFAPLELDDVTTYPLITKALLEKGYSKKDVTKIMGGNILRVLKANEKNTE